MLTVLRHLLSILLLPFMAAVVAPYWLLETSDATLWNDGAVGVWFLRSAGIVLLLSGFALFIWCVALFARVGQGTLAPWDPTRRLVAVGPYRFVRNPMISGVAMLLVGQGLFWGSLAIAVWACAFILINHVYFVVSEEPGLNGRYGDSYRVYKASVPRWIPRLTPWRLTDHER